MKVQDKYRTNTLSVKPGGTTVMVKLKSGKILEYDKIKNPFLYIKQVLKNSDVESAWIKK